MIASLPPSAGHRHKTFLSTSCACNKTIFSLRRENTDRDAFHHRTMDSGTNSEVSSPPVLTSVPGAVMSSGTGSAGRLSPAGSSPPSSSRPSLVGSPHHDPPILSELNRSFEACNKSYDEDSQSPDCSLGGAGTGPESLPRSSPSPPPILPLSFAATTSALTGGSIPTMVPGIYHHNSHHHHHHLPAQAAGAPHHRHGGSMYSPPLGLQNASAVPPPSSAGSNSSSINECKLIDYRGAKIAAFVVNCQTLLCLPQAFELFLKHLVGGLHTVYTKLKRLEVTPIVCNVEQVRILRGLGAIQPGVNRCKLLSCNDFDLLYKDCTTARYSTLFI